MSVTRIGENTTSIWNCPISRQIYTLAHQTSYIQKFTCYKLYLFNPLFSEKPKKTRTDQSRRGGFCLVWTETIHKPSKVKLQQKYQLQQMFFPVCVLLVQLINRHVFAFFGTNDLKEVLLYFFISRIIIQC